MMLIRYINIYSENIDLLLHYFVAQIEMIAAEVRAKIYVHN